MPVRLCGFLGESEPLKISAFVGHDFDNPRIKAEPGPPNTGRQDAGSCSAGRVALLRTPEWVQGQHRGGRIQAVAGSLSLPGDWSADATPPFGPEYPASKGYRSSSGAHGEVWIANAQIGGGYEVHFQLISAPSQPTANPPHTNPLDDDPIGQGGFITPPNR